MNTLPDPLGVRSGSQFVMERAGSVRIDQQRVHEIGRQIASHQALPAAATWESDHLGSVRLNDHELANFVLVLDALNFYFWGEPRWTVHYRGRSANGYQALVNALQRALTEGYPITSARYLSTIPSSDVAHILRGESIIPEFAARVHNLREAGQALLREHDGSFLSCIQEAGESPAALLRQLITLFPSFVDVRRYDGRTIPFYKRAQILVSDIAAAFEARGTRLYDDLSLLTAFADYKVPQVLHQLGVLKYTPEVIRTLELMEIVPEGSRIEVEIRAATVVAVDNIMLSTFRADFPVPAYAVDWYLWRLGQQERLDRLTYHLTPTISY